jgi:hypothetical protein
MRRTHTCRRQEILEVYQTSFIDLVHKAAVVHRMYNDPSMVRQPGGGQHGA